MSNDQFQSEILQRLTRVETKLDMVIPKVSSQSRQIAALKQWRTKVIAYAGGVALTVEVLIKAIELARHAG